MPKPLRLLLLILLWTILLGGGFVFYWLQDANRLKPQLEEIIEAQTGVPVHVEGDLAWRLWPPVSLSAETVSADYQGQAWSIARLELDIGVTSMLRDPEVWQVQALTLEGVEMREAGDLLEVQTLTVRNFSPGRPAPVNTRLVYTANAQPPLPLNLGGNLTYDPQTSVIQLDTTRFDTDLAAGACDLTLRPDSASLAAPPAREEDLLPLDLLLGYSWSGSCLLDRLDLDSERFSAVSLTLQNEAGRSSTRMSFPQFFGGNAVLELEVNAGETPGAGETPAPVAKPVLWTLTPKLNNVDSQRLLAWLDQRQEWLAPLAYGGTLRFEGNTEAELIASMSGETRFDGGKGSINITAIKQQILSLATLLQEGDRIRGWPDVWEYQRFVGDWRIDRQHHVLDLALDNLTVEAEGDYLPETGKIDLVAQLTFSNDPLFPIFDVNPLLFDLPIPVRCQGQLADPNCAIDQAAAQRIVASALQSGDATGLRGKLERKIEEEVPEEYQDAARSLLDIFSRSAPSAPQEN